MTGLLALQRLSVSFGGTRVLDDVSLDVDAGTVAGLIGPNGAGKTTLLDAVTGFVQHDGTVALAGSPLAGLPVHERARRGLSRTFQGLELFEDLDVRENLRVVADPAGTGDGVDGVLDRLDLRGVADRRPSTLSHDQRARVALARALAARPQVLLLDEPAAGLDDAQRVALGELLRELAAEGVAVVLIDHDTDLVLRTCDVVHVLQGGRLLATGTPAQVRTDPRVLDAYLGAQQVEATQRAPATHPAAPVLVARGLGASYGKVPVLQGVSLTVSPGEVLAVLGRNGAGKSTLLRALAGLQPITTGSLELLGGRPRGAVRAARRGLMLMPQDRGLFLRLTARQNLRLARGRVPWDSVLPRFPELAPLLDQPAAELSGGQQQQLALARALLTGPRLLLVDELSLGLAPQVVEQLLQLLRSAADDTGLAVVLVEQHVQLALAVADRGLVLDRGRVAAEGTAQQLAADRTLLHASYFGDDGDAMPGVT